MNDETYEDYIRTILGYPKPTQNYYDNIYQPIQDFTNKNIEEFYPEIYKIVYPMVKKACSNPAISLNSDNIEKLADEIYMAVEENSANMQNNRNTTNISKEPVKVEKKQENREVRNNNTLRDLIKILLIRDLIGRPNYPGSRPSMRPPFPIAPGPRMYDIYEN